MDMTRFIFVFVLCFFSWPVFGQLGPHSFTNGNTIIVDAAAGNNSTAMKYRSDKPFKDPRAAKNAAVAGDTIIVRRGTYNTNDLWKAGVTYWFDDGAVVQFTDPGSGPGYGIFDDRSDPGTTNMVMGFGTFRHVQAGFSGSIRGTVTLTHSLSRMHFQAQRIEVSGGQVGLTYAAIHMTNGTLFAKLDEIITTGTAGVDFNSAIYFKSGYADITANYIHANGHLIYAQEASGTTNGLLIVNGGKWVQPPNIGIYGIKLQAASVGTINTNFVVSVHVNLLETDGPCVYGDIGILHLVADKIETIGTGTGYAALTVAYTCDFYVRANKAIQPHPDGHFVFTSDNTYLGRSVLDIKEWQNYSTTDEIVRLQAGGTVDILPGYMRAANGRGIRVDGTTGAKRIIGVHVDTSATDNVTNNPVYISSTGGSTLSLENCILQAPPLAAAIRGTNTIAIGGTLQANKTNFPGILFSSGSFMLDTNLYVSGTNVVGWQNISSLTASRALASDANKNVVPSATTATELGYVNGVTSAIQTQIDTKSAGGYTLLFLNNVAVSPADATTYYIGADMITGLGTVWGDARVEIPKTGTIKRIFVKTRITTVGTTESVPISLRLNDTTDTALTAQVWNVNTVDTANSGLSIAVTAGDYIALKIVTPTWVTNPLTVRLYVVVYIE